MNNDLLAELEARFACAMQEALGDDLPEGSPTLIAPAKNPEFGDFQCNAAMGLAKRLGEKPRDVAQKIVDAVDLGGLADAPDIAGPGFINIRLRPEALDAALRAMDDGTLGVTAPATVETVVVDLCGVNLAKQMHVGHLRATVIGDALARLNERLGHNVVRQNHFGDWGLPIAMVTEAVKAKLDAGASEAITQFFFEADTFLRFRDACAAAGISAPIRPGILPVENWAGAQRFATRCGTTIPQVIRDGFENATRTGDADLFATAIATELCDDLLQEGVDALHFYTLNRPSLTRDICHALGLSPEVRLQNVA